MDSMAYGSSPIPAGFAGFLSQNTDSPPAPPKPKSKGIDNSVYAKAEQNAEQGAKRAGEIEKSISETPLPTPPDIKPAPKNEDFHTDPMKTFGSPAMWLATFGSLMTRRPLTSALNSAAGVMNAVNQGDEAAYKKSFEEWKANTENAWKMADWNQKHLEDILTRNKDDLSAVNTEANLWGVATQSSPLVVASKMSEVAQHYADLKLKNVEIDKALKDGQAVTDRTEELKATHPDWSLSQRYMTATQEMAAAKKPAASSIVNTPYENMTKPEQNALDNDSKDWSNGMPITQLIRGYGKDAGARLEQIKENADRLGLNTDRAKSTIDYAGRQSEARGEQGAIGQRSGTTEVGVGEFDQLIEPTRASIHKLDMGNFKDYNAFVASYDTHFNDPDYIEAFNNIQELQNAYTSVLVRGGRRSDAAQALSEHTVNTLFGKEGSDRALDTMAANTKRIMKGIGNAKAGTVGQDSALKTYSPSDYKKAIADKTLKSGDSFLDANGVEHKVD